MGIRVPGLIRALTRKTGSLRTRFWAVLLLRRKLLGSRILWPLEAVDPVRVLVMLMAAARRGGGLHVTSDGGDLTGVQSAPLARARAILTAAPPRSRASILAGATA
jgi:hypothetical protein